MPTSNKWFQALASCCVWMNVQRFQKGRRIANVNVSKQSYHVGSFSRHGGSSNPQFFALCSATVEKFIFVLFGLSWRWCCRRHTAAAVVVDDDVVVAVVIDVIAAIAVDVGIVVAAAQLLLLLLLMLLLQLQLLLFSDVSKWHHSIYLNGDGSNGVRRDAQSPLGAKVVMV